MMLAFPFVVYGWDAKLFGILVSAYATGMIIEDFGWDVVNLVVEIREFWTDFSDYYPWIRIKGRKIVPSGYIYGLGIALLSWYFLWR